LFFYIIVLIAFSNLALLTSLTILLTGTQKSCQRLL